MGFFEGKPLFIFEMANNHMGSLAHGKALVTALAAAARPHDFRFAVKLQYRHLDSFIRPDYRNRLDVKHVKRFQETRLSEAELDALAAFIRDQGFLTVVTPFDEPSVDLAERQEIDVLKVASCSFTDWPLLERLARVERPLILSTAGMALEEIDKVVSFLEHRGKSFALMHCVALYPTPPEGLQLNQIDVLRARYPAVPIGFSTHEPPADPEPIALAVAKGARLFEKHAGLPTPVWPLNAYSANPDEIVAWLAAAARAYRLCGVTGERHPFPPEESGSLKALQRGIFARHAIAAGEIITQEQVYFAFPPDDHQLTAQDWSKYTRFIACREIAADAPLTPDNTEREELRQQVYSIVQRVRGLLRTGHIVVPGKAELEISHHYGLSRFEAFGLTMITVVNREYCKKLLVMLPGQTHPEQYHLKKEETFLILHGRVTIALDGVEREYGAGDLVTVAVGVKHRFHTEEGTVFEEISSTHFKDDSYYTDPAINANRHRKTYLTYWLR